MPTRIIIIKKWYEIEIYAAAQSVYRVEFKSKSSPGHTIIVNINKFNLKPCLWNFPKSIRKAYFAKNRAMPCCNLSHCWYCWSNVFSKARNLKQANCSKLHLTNTYLPHFNLILNCTYRCNRGNSFL